MQLRTRLHFTFLRSKQASLKQHIPHYKWKNRTPCRSISQHLYTASAFIIRQAQLDILLSHAKILIFCAQTIQILKQVKL